MTDTAVYVLCAVVVFQAGALAWIASKLLTERDHLLARTTKDIATVERARKNATPQRVQRTPEADIWAADLAAEQLAMMGDGERHDRVQPMPIGMDGHG